MTSRDTIRRRSVDLPTTNNTIKFFEYPVYDHSFAQRHPSSIALYGLIEERKRAL